MEILFDFLITYSGFFLNWEKLKFPIVKEKFCYIRELIEGLAEPILINDSSFESPNFAPDEQILRFLN